MPWYAILLLSVGALVCVYMLFCVVLSVLVPKLMLHPKGSTRMTFAQVRADQTAHGAVDYAAYDRQPKESITIQNGAVEIPGEFLPAQTAKKAGERPKCVIRVHGFTQNRLMSVRFLPVFQALGYDAVIYDQRAFGDSTQTQWTLGYREKEDLSAVISWVKQHLGADTLICVHGESLGAITALETLGIDDRIDLLVADSGCSDLYQGAGWMLHNIAHLPAFPLRPLLARQFQKTYGISMKTMRPIENVASTKTPILFLHGTADKQLPAYMSEEMVQVAKNPLSRLELFAGADHCQGHAREPARYEAIVQQFVLDVENTLE